MESHDVQMALEPSRGSGVDESQDGTRTVWIGPKEAAEILGVSKAWVHRLIASGRLRASTVSGRVKILERSVVVNFPGHELRRLAVKIAEGDGPQARAWHDLRAVQARMMEMHPEAVDKVVNELLGLARWHRSERNGAGTEAGARLCEDAADVIRPPIRPRRRGPIPQTSRESDEDGNGSDLN